MKEFVTKRYKCVDCSMQAGPSYEEKGKYVMTLTLRDTGKSYTINWYKSKCEVFVWSMFGSGGYVKLPILPYDVNLDKFQTYLLFS